MSAIGIGLYNPPLQRTKGSTVVASLRRPGYLCRVLPFTQPLAADYPTVMWPCLVARNHRGRRSFSDDNRESYDLPCCIT